MTDLQKVRLDGYAIRHIKNQTPEVCLAAIRQVGYAIKYIKNQTPELCLVAVEQNGNVIKYIRKDYHHWLTEHINLTFEEYEIKYPEYLL